MKCPYECTVKTEHGYCSMKDIGKDLQEAYDEGFWDAFSTITSAAYGKERFFLEDDGCVYDRDKAVYYKNKEEALARYLEEMRGDEG